MLKNYGQKSQKTEKHFLVERIEKIHLTQHLSMKNFGVGT